MVAVKRLGEFHLGDVTGLAETERALGWAYQRAQDFTAAVTWYRQAADKGNPDAQYNLGAVYASGKGVPRDDVTALMWLNLAASAGNQDALEEGYAVERRMSPAQVAEARKLAQAWKPRAN